MQISIHFYKFAATCVTHLKSRTQSKPRVFVIYNYNYVHLTTVKAEVYNFYIYNYWNNKTAVTYTYHILCTMSILQLTIMIVRVKEEENFLFFDSNKNKGSVTFKE